MARFRAYVTDSEDEEEDVSMEVPPQKPPPVARNHARDEDDSMDEDDLQPVTRPKATYEEESSEEEEEEIDESKVGVGSIAAGGRYDNLVGMFTAAAAGEGKKAAQLPCIGVSIGMDRIFAIVWPRWVERGMRSKDTMAYVMAAGDGLLTERLRLVQELRAAGIKVRVELDFR